MHIILAIFIVLVVLGAIGGLTYLFTMLLVGPKKTQPQPLPLEKPTNNLPTKIDLSSYKPVDDGDYLKIANYDSPGNNIIKWDDPKNFNMTIDKCKQRCKEQKDCVAFGWDPSQKNYCTSKTKVNLPLSKWTGVLYVKK